MHASNTVKPHCPPEFSHRCEGVEFESSPSRLINRHFEAERTPMNIRPRSYPPAFNDIGEWAKNGRKKCQQKCQQNSSRVARGQNSTVPPAPLVNTSISVPKVGGEGRRFRPSPEDSGGYDWIRADYPRLRFAGTRPFLMAFICGF